MVAEFGNFRWSRVEVMLYSEIGRKLQNNVTMDKRRKGNANCCVRKCKNRVSNTTSDVKFYVLPTAGYKALQREQWIRWIRRMNSNDWQPSKYSRICSQHFVGNKVSTIASSPAYVPSIVIPNTGITSVKQKSSIERFERILKRRLRPIPITSPIKVKNNADGFSKSVLRVDEGIQVRSIDQSYKNPFGEDSKVFLCSHYICNDICHAQVQVYIPEDTETLEMFRELNTTDENCVDNAPYVNRAMGSDHPAVNLENISKCSMGFNGFSSITENQEMHDLCGVNLTTFDILLRMLKHIYGTEIQNEDRLVMFLMKFKAGLTFSQIAILFHMERSAVAQIFFSLLKTLRIACANFILWPCRQVVQNGMSDAFKQYYPNCRVIIDIIQIKIEEPESEEVRKDMYSVYRKRFICKALIGCTPSGAVSFVSKCFTAYTTDYQVTASSKILDSLETGDTVLAVKDFHGLNTFFDKNKRQIVISMSQLLFRHQVSRENVEETKVAGVRTQAEKPIHRFRSYKILDELSFDLLPYVDDILFMCAVLVNLQSPIIETAYFTND